MAENSDFPDKDNNFQIDVKYNDFERQLQIYKHDCMLSDSVSCARIMFSKNVLILLVVQFDFEKK